MSFPSQGRAQAEETREAQSSAEEGRLAGDARAQRDGLSRGSQRDGSGERSTVGHGPHAGLHRRTSAPWTRLCLIWRPPGSPHHPASAAWSWGEGRLGGGRESAVQLGGAGICGHLVGWDLQPLFPVPGGPSWPPWDPVRRPRHEELRVDTEPCGFSSPVWGNGKLVFDWNLLRGPAEAGAGGQRRHLIAAASPLTLVLQQKKEERKEKNIKKSQYFN